MSCRPASGAGTSSIGASGGAAASGIDIPAAIACGSDRVRPRPRQPRAHPWGPSKGWHAPRDSLLAGAGESHTLGRGRGGGGGGGCCGACGRAVGVWAGSRHATQDAMRACRSFRHEKTHTLIDLSFTTTTYCTYGCTHLVASQSLFNHCPRLELRPAGLLRCHHVALLALASALATTRATVSMCGPASSSASIRSAPATTTSSSSWIILRR